MLEPSHGSFSGGRLQRPALVVLTLMAVAACGSKDDAPGGGLTTSASNDCQNGGPGCSSATVDTTGGYLTIDFGAEQAVASSGTAPGTASDVDTGIISVGVSPDEDLYNCSTTQPDDEFRDVRCASYSMGSYSQAPLDEWLCFTYFQAATGQSGPVTLRVSDLGGGEWNLQTAWGFCSCSVEGPDGTTGTECDGRVLDGRGTVERDGCCDDNADCASNRCCTPDQQCFTQLDDRWTCRDPA